MGYVPKGSPAGIHPIPEFYKVRELLAKIDITGIKYFELLCLVDVLGIKHTELLVGYDIAGAKQVPFKIEYDVDAIVKHVLERKANVFGTARFDVYESRDLNGAKLYLLASLQALMVKIDKKLEAIVVSQQKIVEKLNG